MRALKVLLLSITFCLLFTLSKIAPSFASSVSDLDCSVFKSNADIWAQAVHSPRWVTDISSAAIVGPATIAAVGSDYGTLCKCAQESEGKSMEEINALKAQPNSACHKLNVYISSSGVGVASKLALGTLQESRDLIKPQYYAKDILNESNLFGKKAYAAGGTHWSLEPKVILDTWKAIRNLAYTGFVIIFIVIGFMIMFRKKMDPQTVVTLQNSLPGVVVSLVLITFSYPIASLIFNVSEPLIGLVRTFFPQVVANGDWPAYIFGAIVAAALTIIFAVVSAPFAVISAVSLFLAIATVTAALSILIAFINIGFRLIFRLGKLIMLVITAPLIMTVAALPGNGSVLANWFKSIISITIQVPIMLFVAYLGLSIMTTSFSVGAWGLPVLGTLFGTVIGIYVLWQAGSVPKTVDAALGVEPMFGGDGGKKKGKK